MKKLLGVVNSYVSDLGLDSLTIIKLGISSFGIFLGLMLGKKHTKPTTIASIFLMLLSALLVVPALYQKCCALFKKEHLEAEDGFVMRIVTEEE